MAGRHGGHALAVAAGEILYTEKLARIHRTTAEQAGFEYLKQHKDKKYSAVDCLSFVIMIQHGITEAFAFDKRDFSHRFIVRPDPE